ncbi:MAG: sodium:solute symporter family protein [Bacteroidetes bacterium]|nr:sodium:solute symporter family protein [Bacteroidota bacterium]
MNIPLIIVICYIILQFGISWYSTRISKASGVLGYLLAGRNLPVILVAVMITGIAVGGASTVGVAEQAYTHGISAGMYNAAWGIAAILVGLIAASRFRKMNITTIPELFERYYGKTGQIIAVIGQVIILMVIISLQYVAGGAILTALLPEFFTFSTGMITTAAVFVGITLIGGYWAAGFSNLINVAVIYIGIIAGIVMSISGAGGFSMITAQLPAGIPWFDPVAGVGWVLVIAWFLVMFPTVFSTQGVVQVSFAAKDAKTAKIGYILGGLLILPIGFLSAIFGIVAAAKFPDLKNASMALPEVVLSFNPWISGITLSGLWAADISTAVGLLLGCATLIIKDIWKVFLQPGISKKQELITSRVIVLVISIVTYILATTVVGILKTLLICLTLTTSYTVILLFSMFLPKLCRKSAAVWTLITGIMLLALWQFVPAIRIVSHPIYLEWPVCIITFLLIYIIDKRPANILPSKF